MKKYCLALLLLLHFSAMHSNASANGNNTLLILGDSISAAYGIPEKSGWVHLLKKKLENHKAGTSFYGYTVVNASISGDTTAGGLQRLPNLLAQYKPKQVIIELGGNDGLRGMSLKAMTNNLQKMIDLSVNGGAKVLLMSVELPSNYGRFFNHRFKKVFDNIEEENGISRVELALSLVKAPGLLQEDGIHPTAKAQPLITDLVWQGLSEQQ